MSSKSKGGGDTVARRWTLLLCLGSFVTGLLFTNRMWTVPEAKDIIRANKAKEHREELVVEGYYSKIMDQKEEARKILGEEGSTTEDDLQMLNKAISNLEMELAAAKMAQESILKGSPIPQELKVIKTRRHKYFMVIGINTAFNSRKRRDSVRDTWMPQGEKRKKLEEEKGIVIRFVIGHGISVSGIHYCRAKEENEEKNNCSLGHEASTTAELRIILTHADPLH